MTDPDQFFTIYFIILLFGVICFHNIPKGVTHFLDGFVDPGISGIVAWHKKRWYTRFLFVFTAPVLVVLGLFILLSVISPLSVIAEILFFFPGKLIYWIAVGKFPNNSSLFIKWEKKDEKSS